LLLKSDVSLVLVTFVTFTGAISRFGTDFFVVLLEGSKIFTSFGELTFFHTFTDIPVDEGTFGVHEVELVIDTREDLSDSSRVGDHADGALDLGQVTTGDYGRGLVVDTALEASGAPVDELDGTLGLDGGNGGVDILGDDITTVHHAASHVLTVTRVAFGHHGGRFEGAVGDFSDRELLVVSFLSGDNRGIRGKHKVDTRVRDQVGLELSDIDVECPIETKRGGQGRDNLANQPVKVGVGRALNIQRTTADIVHSLIVEHDADVGVLEERVGGQDTVVGLDNSGGDLRGGVDGEAQLGFLAVVDGKTFQEEGTETGTGTTTDSVEDQETLETSAVIGEFTDAVEGEVDNFLTDGVVTTGVVVGGIFLTSDQLFGVEKLTVGTSTDFIDDSGLEVEEDGTRDVFASTSFGEEGVEGIVTTTDSFIGGHLTIGLDTVFKAVEFPAGITDLDTSLTEMNREDFTHVESLSKRLEL
jgi:hypothetical protein